MSLSPRAIFFSECLGSCEVENCSDCWEKDEHRNYTAQAPESHWGISCKFLPQSICALEFSDISCELKTLHTRTEISVCIWSWNDATFLPCFFFFPWSFRWLKDGEEFDPGTDPELKVTESLGSFEFSVLSDSMDTLKQYQGKYVCYASNELGTAVSNEAVLRTDGKGPVMTH